MEKLPDRAYRQGPPTSRLRRAIRWDLRLPRPLLILLVLDLLLLVPVPFLLPALWAAPDPIPGSAVALGLPPLLPQLASRQPAPAREVAEAAPVLPFLIDPVRFQHAPAVDSNLIAAQLDHLAPELAAQRLEVGGIEQSLAQVITGQALRWNLNPQVLLVLLETQRQLRSSTPTTATLEQALGGPAEQYGLELQISWATRSLRAGMLEPIRSTVDLNDGTLFSVPAGLDQANYALLRFLALTHSQAELERLLGVGPGSWVALARPIMGDPRAAAALRVDDAPFLQRPFAGALPFIARFDHQYPLVQADGLMVGSDAQPAPGYDGHNGWDFALPAAAPVLAAAPGRVIYAGWMDNECRTAAGVVYVQHANGYRTAYWHLARIDLAAGDQVEAGTRLGLNGATGCAEAAHLHFGVQRLGRDVDPAGWCAATADPWATHPAGAVSRWLWQAQPDPCPLPPGAILADENNPATTVIMGDRWQPAASGSYSQARWMLADPAQRDHQVVWRPLLAAAGRYQIAVFVPGAVPAGAQAVYQITHAGGVSRVAVAQGDHAGSWVKLGGYDFLAGQTGKVTLCACAGAAGQPVWVDVLAFIPQPPRAALR